MVNALKKKILFLAAMLTLSVTLFAGCGKSDTNNSATSPSKQEDSTDMPSETELPDNADDGAVKDDTDNGTDKRDGVTDDAGNAVDDAVDGAGDAVKDITGGAKDAVDDTVDGAEDAVDDVTGDKDSNKR